MAELGSILSRLGLEQYLESFIEEGFDSWEVVLDITESDLDALGVRLGHRRKLQREIANARGFHIERLLASPTRSLEDGRGGGPDERAYAGKHTGKYHGVLSGKRKYRRHPKPDDNAPDRPPSAYVIFSNKIREELRPQNLTFTEIAKRVGESWQVLLAEEKEPYESQASIAKEKYHAEIIRYKKTDEHKEYSKYLSEFKAKNASISDGKRPRPEKEASIASSGSTGSQAEILEAPLSGAFPSQRPDPFGSNVPYSYNNGYPSPGGVAVTMAPPSLFGSHSSTLGSGSPDPVSPLSTHRGDTAQTAAPSSFQPSSKMKPSNEYILDKASEIIKGSSLPRIAPLERRDSRASLIHNPKLVSDPKVLRSRKSPPQNLRRPKRPSTAALQHNASMSSNSSSISSTLSSGIATPASIYTPMTPHDDTRPQRSLPPLSTTGLKFMASSSYVGPTGQPSNSSLPGQPSTCIRPMPQNSAFVSSSPGVLSEQVLDRRSLSQEAQETPQLQNRPFLPNLTQVTSDRDQRLMIKDDDPTDTFSNSQSDPLAVLAYAGRMVDRGGR